MSFFKKVSKDEKAAIDAAGETILRDFASSLKNGIPANDKINLVIVQQHFNWTKKNVSNSKVAYIQMVNNYTKDPKAVKYFNSIQEGLPEYIKQAASVHISEVI